MMKQLLFVIATLVCCNAVFSQSDEKANILAVERNTANAFTKHDIVFLNSVFSDNVSLITPKGEFITKQQLLQYVQNINSCTVSEMQVNIIGAIAVVTGVETETGKDNTGVYSNKTRFTDVLQKNKGQWQIIASQGTAIGQ